MRQIDSEQLHERIRTENPWWAGKGIGDELDSLTPRAYFDLLFPLITELSVRRAIVLMGPRRVGKTVLIHPCHQGLARPRRPPETDSVCLGRPSALQRSRTRSANQPLPQSCRRGSRPNCICLLRRGASISKSGRSISRYWSIVSHPSSSSSLALPLRR